MTDTKPELLLYVWAEFSSRFTPKPKAGLAFAIAENVEQAKEIVCAAFYGQEYDSKDPHWQQMEKYLVWGEMKKLPINQPTAFAVDGNADDD